MIKMWSVCIYSWCTAYLPGKIKGIVFLKRQKHLTPTEQCTGENQSETGSNSFVCFLWHFGSQFTASLHNHRLKSVEHCIVLHQFHWCGTYQSLIVSLTGCFMQVMVYNQLMWILQFEQEMDFLLNCFRSWIYLVKSLRVAPFLKNTHKQTLSQH